MSISYMTTRELHVESDGKDSTLTLTAGNGRVAILVNDDNYELNHVFSVTAWRELSDKIDKTIG